MDLSQRFSQFKERNSQEASASINDRVLLIDAMNLYIRNFSALPTLNDDGEHIGGVSGFLLSLGAAIRLHHPTRVIVVFDGQGGSQRRRKLFPEYKAQRRMLTRLNRAYDFGSVEREQDSMKWQLVRLVELLSHLPVTIFHVDNVEADDVIAYLANHLSGIGGTSIIMSNDKDFLQLANDNISIWNPSKKKMYRPQSIVEDYGFHPNNFLMYRAITGDKSDNIPGVAGVKEKTLLKYVPALAETYKQTPADVMSHIRAYCESVKKPPVALQSLLASEELIERNFELMRLDDELQMSTNAKIKVLDKFDTPPPKLNKYQLTISAQRDNIISAFRMWDDWVVKNFAPLNAIATKTSTSDLNE